MNRMVDVTRTDESTWSRNASRTGRQSLFIGCGRTLSGSQPEHWRAGAAVTLMRDGFFEISHLQGSASRVASTQTRLWTHESSSHVDSQPRVERHDQTDNDKADLLSRLPGRWSVRRSSERIQLRDRHRCGWNTRRPRVKSHIGRVLEIVMTND